METKDLNTNFKKINDVICGQNENYTWFYNIENLNLIFSDVYAFSKEFIISNKIYDRWFNTYTNLASDARDAVIRGTTGAVGAYLDNNYNSNTQLDLAIWHYHAMDVDGYSFAEHSFFGNFYGTVTNTGSQPIC